MQKRTRSRSKPRVYKRRRYVPRSLARASKGSLNNWGVHRFKRTWTMHEFVVGASGSQSYNFKLDSLPSYTEFTGLYDLYRVLKWVVKFYYAGSENDVSGAKNETGLIGTAIDYNDSNVAASLDEMRQYSSYKERQLIKCHPFVRVFTPRLNTMLYKSVSSTGYSAPRRNPYVATVDAGVPHFGLKTWYQTPPNTTMNITVVGTVYLAFKAVK